MKYVQEEEEEEEAKEIHKVKDSQVDVDMTFVGPSDFVAS